MSTRPDARACLLEGIGAARTGDRRRAQRRLREATELDPESAVAWHWRAYVAPSMDEACKHLERCLALDPDNRKAGRDLHRLRAGPARRPRRVRCPFCSEPQDRLRDRCPSCRAVLSFARPRLALANREVDPEQLRAVLARKAVRVARGGNVAVHRVLALGHLNLGSLGPAVDHLDRFVRARPDARRDAVHLASLRRLREQREAVGAGRLRVLVIDPSAAIRKLARVALERRGYAVQGVAGAGEAERWLAQEVPDVVLVGARVPDGSGYEICRRVKDRSETSHVPVVLMTGSGATEDPILGRRVGVAAYLPKPFDPLALGRTVDRLCGPLPPAGEQENA